MRPPSKPFWGNGAEAPAISLRVKTWLEIASNIQVGFTVCAGLDCSPSTGMSRSRARLTSAKACDEKPSTRIAVGPAWSGFLFDGNVLVIATRTNRGHPIGGWPSPAPADEFGHDKDTAWQYNEFGMALLFRVHRAQDRTAPKQGAKAEDAEERKFSSPEVIGIARNAEGKPRGRRRFHEPDQAAPTERPRRSGADATDPPVAARRFPPRTPALATRAGARSFCRRGEAKSRPARIARRMINVAS